MPEAWRTIRIFVSSTFRDLHEEREELLKRVFPRLRKLCAERGVTWGEVDLRWGITDEQSKRGEVLPICLAEIDRCRPFFLCVLGERYGWVPPPGMLATVMERHPWLASQAGASVTELEILHGAFNDSGTRPEAFFYLRDPAYIDGLPAERQSDHRETDADRREKLRALKDRIRRSGGAVQDGYRDPADFGSRVLGDLTALVNRLYPPPAGVPDPLDRDVAEHEAFAQSRIGVYVGREAYFRQLDAFAALPEAGGPGLAVVGESGSGKSALLANWVARHRVAHSEDVVLYHALGATPSSADGSALLRRILGELARRLGSEGTVPDSPAALQSAFLAALPRIDRKVVLVLDGLNHLEDRDGYPDLLWLPEVLPARLRLVVATLPGRPLDALAKRQWPLLTVEPLTAAERRAVLTEVLRQAGKRLSEERVARVVEAQPSANPLFLHALLEELRLFGMHELLDQRLDLYLAPRDADGTAPTPGDLFGRILQRYESDYEDERPGLVRDAMALLWASRRGLAEDELLMLLGPGDGTPLPQAYWAPLFFAAEHALMDRAGRFTFFHDAMRNAVRDRYLATGELQRAMHFRLADYFATRQWLVGVRIVGADDLPEELARFANGADVRVLDPRQVEELPWQLARAGEWRCLAETLADLGFLDEAWKASRPDVEAYWGQLYAESPWRATDAYRRVIEDPVKHKSYLDAVSLLLGFLGHVHETSELDRHLVEHYRATGEDDSHLARHLHGLGVSLRLLGELDEAMALHREEEEICRRLGMQDLLAGCLGAQGQIHRRRGELERAIALHQEEERIARELNKPALLAVSLNSRALVLRAKHAPDEEVVACYRELERIARQNNDHWMLAHTLNSLQGLAFNPLRGKPRWSIEELGYYFHHVFPLLEEAYELARNGHILSLAEELRPAYEEARAGLRSYAQMLTRNGVDLFRRGELDEALVWYARAEEVYRLLHDDEGVSICLGERALVLLERGDDQGALELMREEEQLCRRLHDLTGLETCLCNQTMLLLKAGDVDGARAALQKREEECGDLIDPAAKGRRLGHWATIHRMRGEFEAALPIVVESERLARQASDFEGMATALQQRAHLLAEMDRFGEAIAAAEEASRLAAQHQLTVLEQQINAFLEILRPAARRPGPLRRFLSRLLGS